MVYYFTSDVIEDTPVTIYMGKHKEENENLIRYGLDEDVWFHVDKLSSAHVYLRLPEGWTWDNIPKEVLNDCAQLTKANSIQGNKTKNLKVVYTPWKNLNKTGDMVDGQVGFKSSKKVKRVDVEDRINNIVNRLNKTKEEHFPDLQAERKAYDEHKARTEAEERRKRMKAEQQLARERKQLAQQRDHAYDDLFTDENMRHAENDNRDEDGEEDFM